MYFRRHSSRKVLIYLFAQKVFQNLQVELFTQLHRRNFRTISMGFFFFLLNGQRVFQNHLNELFERSFSWHYFRIFFRSYVWQGSFLFFFYGIQRFFSRPNSTSQIYLSNILNVFHISWIIFLGIYYFKYLQRKYLLRKTGIYWLICLFIGCVDI